MTRRDAEEAFRWMSITTTASLDACCQWAWAASTYVRDLPIGTTSSLQLSSWIYGLGSAFEALSFASTDEHPAVTRDVLCELSRVLERFVCQAESQVATGGPP